jgi:hypothetical protein
VDRAYTSKTSVKIFTQNMILLFCYLVCYIYTFAEISTAYEFYLMVVYKKLLFKLIKNSRMSVFVLIIKWAAKINEYKTAVWSIRTYFQLSQ